MHNNSADIWECDGQPVQTYRRRPREIRIGIRSPGEDGVAGLEILGDTCRLVVGRGAITSLGTAAPRRGRKPRNNASVCQGLRLPAVTCLAVEGEGGRDHNFSSTCSSFCHTTYDIFYAGHDILACIRTVRHVPGSAQSWWFGAICHRDTWLAPHPAGTARWFF